MKGLVHSPWGLWALFCRHYGAPEGTYKYVPNGVPSGGHPHGLLAYNPKDTLQQPVASSILLFYSWSTFVIPEPELSRLSHDYCAHHSCFLISPVSRSLANAPELGTGSPTKGQSAKVGPFQGVSLRRWERPLPAPSWTQALPELPWGQPSSKAQGLPLLPSQTGPCVSCLAALFCPHSLHLNWPPLYLISLFGLL